MTDVRERMGGCVDDREKGKWSDRVVKGESK